jgi:putative lipoprotein
VRGLLLLSLAFGGPARQEPPRDRWLGRDKVKHFLVSAFAQSATYATLQAAGADREGALLGATAATAALGVAKEVGDRRRGGPFSVRDLTWDAAGAGAATLLLVRTER